MISAGVRRISAFLLALSVAGAATVAGQTSAAAPRDRSDGARWSGTFDIGATGASGNTRSLTLVGGAAARFEGARWNWDLETDVTVVDLESSEDRGTSRRHEDHEVDSRLRRFFGSRLYGLFRVTWDRKPTSGIVSDLQSGLGLGADLRPSTRTALHVEGGLSAVDERRTREPEDVQYLSLFLDGRWAWTLSSGATLTWRGDLRFGTEEGSDLKSDQELEIDAPLNERLSVGVVLEWERNSDPPGELRKDDYRLASKLTVKL